MRGFIQRLLARDERALSIGETILWWERRRIPYNLVVGCAGVISIASAVLTAWSTKSGCGIPDPPVFALFGIILYGLAANVMYTGGWLVELAVRRHVGARRFAQRALLVGLSFSVLLTISPAFVVPVGCAMN